MHDKQSLGARLLVPIFLIIAMITIALLLLVHTISNRVHENYMRFALAAEGADVDKMLSSAATELTAARLLDNPMVVEAKQQSVLESIRLSWFHTQHDGFITDADGHVMLSTLSPEQVKAIAARRVDGYFSADHASESFRCYSHIFPLWQWTVITVNRHTVTYLSGTDIALLVPIVGLGSLLMAGGFFFVYREKLRKPVAAMVTSVATESDVQATGIAELDRIGDAVNSAMAGLKARTAELERELQERKKAEDSARSKDEHIQLLLESTAEGIFGIDRSGTCTFCNHACITMLGFSADDDLLGKHIHSVIHYAYPDSSPYPDSKCRVYSAFRNGRGIHVTDEVFWRKDGSSINVEYWSYPVIENGMITGAVVTFIDVTERIKLEKQLLQSQKMEAIGQLAGGIAHDFNNLLTAINGYSELLQSQLPDHDHQRHYIDQIRNAGEKAAELTRGLLAFSRKQVITPKAVDLNSIVKDMEKILRRIISENIVMKTTLLGRDLVVLADRNQVDQIIMNLATNASDAMPDGGQLTLETSYFERDDPFLREYRFIEPGAYACLSVSDTGIGMDETTKQMIFEPFFTTKGVGHGTGLGLSIVYGIVKQHNGFIIATSEQNKGTTFKVLFPMVAQKAEDDEPAPPTQGGTETLLVAEDDTVVQLLLKDMLERYGYTVILACDGASAIKTLEKNKDRIDLALLDIVMPERNGYEAFEAMKMLKPDLKAIFMSGYVQDIIGKDAFPPGDLLFVEKPIVTSTLMGMIRNLLDKKNIL